MLQVKDIMTTEVVTLAPEATIRDAMEALSTNHLGGIPVIAGDRVTGVVSMTDILNFIVSAPQNDVTGTTEPATETWDEDDDDDIVDDDEIEGAAVSSEVWERWSDAERTDDAVMEGSSLFDQHTVAEVMTDDIFSITPSSSIQSAATIMKKRGIHRVLVMEGSKLVGIVSALDIARVVSDKGISGKTGVRVAECPENPSPWIML